jgi:hypothetical protein
MTTPNSIKIVLMQDQNNALVYFSIKLAGCCGGGGFCSRAGGRAGSHAGSAAAASTPLGTISGNSSSRFPSGWDVISDPRSQLVQKTFA